MEQTSDSVMIECLEQYVAHSRCYLNERNLECFLGLNWLGEWVGSNVNN